MGMDAVPGINGIGSVPSTSPVSQTSPKEQRENAVSFQDMMLNLREKKQESLSFSKHAAKRMDERGIEMNESLMGDLENAVDKARGKGAREVAVIGRDGIFIVNVPNNVVVTTMGQEDMNDKVLTNIDSAVIMNNQDPHGNDSSLA